ncbi:DEAD/DEAH box helicase [Streptomyces sp. M54]|uniref:DEAD/DEAH box helicase n=1 Tax=Streptomyces sp. M54 TaxID=2759525 RepID=UPI001A8E26F9|nr:DEAD/DEAH box helicase [Streptomyces sp. M54]QSS91687.1 DEAD/DEAH box helicase [Streptomyces sp. M54]
MAFKLKSADAAMPDDPVDLYRILALTNHGPEFVWGHQQDVLRDWHEKKSEASDVAIELPTGAGKTLVGGLIGEYWRRKYGERVAYLCPTRQLARQTAAKFDEYGIPNVLLVNRVKTWNPAHQARYEAGEVVAVSVYSHVFNSNPAIDNAGMLVLDDAHAAEGYVASPWSLSISRKTEESAYLDVLSVLKPALDPLVDTRLRAPEREGMSSYVYLASPIGVAEQSLPLEQAVAAAAHGSKLSTDAFHAWKLLQGRLDRCLIFVSYGQILIRPLIAPTAQHHAFNSPARRVYMSATLGDGGELERSFGRRKIERIPVPKGWESRGTGRRFFLFPELTDDLATSPERVPAFVSKVVSSAGRAVVLTPDTRTAETFAKECLPKAFPVVKANDVEDNLTTFTAMDEAALLLTNRYDGIDLPGDDCRLVVLAGLPARGDLQERFLHESLGALEVLQERIRARIVQGSGRATRSNKDWAAVMVLGRSLTSYLSGPDVQTALHPEVHAEVEFGRANSLGAPSSEMLDNLAVFRRHEQDWAAVDAHIAAQRDQYTRTVAPSARELHNAARHEVAVWEALWNNQWDWALTAVQRVLDQLKGERTPQRYAALWNYLGYSIAERLAQQSGDSSHRDTGARYYRELQRKAQTSSFLAHIASPSDRAHAPVPSDLDPIDEAAMLAVIARTELHHPDRFEQTLTEARAGLAGSEYRAYEAGLVHLGTFAGASESYGNDDDANPASPDAVWIFDDARWITWEAKSEATSTGEIGPDSVRQAQGHLRYTESERKASAPSGSIALLMSPKPKIMDAARMLANDQTYLVRPSTVLEVLDRLIRSWRTARARTITVLGTTELADIFRGEQALPSQWLPLLESTPIGEHL